MSKKNKKPRVIAATFPGQEHMDLKAVDEKIRKSQPDTPVDNIRDSCVLCMYWKLKPDHGAMGVCREGPVYQDRLATDWCGKCRKPEIRT